MDTLEGLEPASVWKYFAELSRIPRCSKREAAAARFVLDTAARLGFEARQDRFGNVVVRKPATPGREPVPSICLQGHLDMVCEKRPDKIHDFTKDPIRLIHRDGVVTADGTTLGADNGIAVATNLAVMEDRSMAHGPLELLFTVDEETGLTGAANLQPGFVESRTLLNLDSEDEGVLYVGCAGGRDTVGAWPIEQEAAPPRTEAVELNVSGLRGGHSGVEIDKVRGNAIKILNRTIVRLGELGVRLARIKGGNKRNAIPRDAAALLFVPIAKRADAAHLVDEMNVIVRAELSSVEPDLRVSLRTVPAPRHARVLTRGLQKKITRVISALPHGLTKMSADIPGLVETSTNVAAIGITRKEVVLETSQRSSVATETDEICETVRSIFELGGARVEHSNGYPGWRPNMDSPILKVAQRTYQSLFGKAAHVKAVHAGLECGIIGERYPGIDMVSFGPTLHDVHSPDEKIDVETVGKFWEFLRALLGNVQ
jgi:dipeptidase D